MLLELESHCLHYSDSEVLATSWMRGFENENDGWLACGNKAGVPSITKTSIRSQLDCDDDDILSLSTTNGSYGNSGGGTSYSNSNSSGGNNNQNSTGRMRSNINLRNVRVPVHIVQWNPVHQKLATCTSSGSILVYKRSRGQWIVDLMNERAHAVEVFKWSRSSYQVMIGYADGLLIVGSVTGHRLWHRTMDMHSVLTSINSNNNHAGASYTTNHSQITTNTTAATTTTETTSNQQSVSNNHGSNNEFYSLNQSLPVTTGLTMRQTNNIPANNPLAEGVDAPGGYLGNRMNLAIVATQHFDPYYNGGAPQRPPETLNFNLSENPFRNNLDDIVIVSRNYRRTTDISTFYHNDSINRYRNINNQLGYELDLHTNNNPDIPNQDNLPNTVEQLEQQRIYQRNLEQERNILRMLGLAGLSDISVDSRQSASCNVEPPGKLEDMPTITCGTWSPNDVILTVATSVGSILSFPFAWERLPLRLVRQRDRLLRLNDSILQIEWSCPAFRPVSDIDPELVAHQMQSMLSHRSNVPNHSNSNNYQHSLEASSQSDNNSHNSTSITPDTHQLYDDSEDFLLAVAFNSGYLYLLKSLEDPNPIRIRTGLSRLCISWSNSGQWLAVGGFIRSANLECQCSIRLYSQTAQLLYSLPVFSMNKPITSLCWAHKDQRIFVSAGMFVHTFRVRSQLPKLSELCCEIIRNRMNFRPELSQRLSPLPGFLRDNVKLSFTKTIQSQLPLPHRLKEYVLLPKKDTTYCVFQRSPNSSNGTTKFILYLDFMGTSFPLLLATKSRSIRSEYSFWDPSLAQFRDANGLFPLEDTEDHHRLCSSYCIWQRRFRTYQRNKNRNQGRNSFAIYRSNICYQQQQNKTTNTQTKEVFSLDETNRLLRICLGNGSIIDAKQPSDQLCSNSHNDRVCYACHKQLDIDDSSFVVNSGDNTPQSSSNQNGIFCSDKFARFAVCNKCLALLNIRFSKLMLHSNLPENLLLAKLKSNVTNNKYELIGSQISLPKLLSRINFEEKLKNSKSVGISIHLIEVKTNTGEKWARYRRDFCHENRSISSSFCADSGYAGVQMRAENELIHNDFNYLSNMSIDSQIIDSCVSTPIHNNNNNPTDLTNQNQRTINSANISTNNKPNFPLNIIRSLPTTPMKPSNNSKSAVKQSHLKKYPIPFCPPAPALRSFLINKHQSVVTWREENVPMFRKTAFYLDNEEVLSTGKIDNDKYFLEFRYPFSPLQAFAFGIANINRLHK